jgi:hypothetical protein
VNDRFFPLLRTGSFVGGDDRSPEIDADRAPSISAAAIPRPSKIPPEVTRGIGETASTTCGTSAIVLTSPQ